MNYDKEIKQMKELQKIYDSEINISINTLWDGGFDLKLGDEMNGYVEEGNVSKATEIIPWFQAAIRTHFPRSRYIHNLMVGDGTIVQGYMTPGGVELAKDSDNWQTIWSRNPDTSKTIVPVLLILPPKPLEMKGMASDRPGEECFCHSDEGCAAVESRGCRPVTLVEKP